MRRDGPPSQELCDHKIVKVGNLWLSLQEVPQPVDGMAKEHDAPRRQVVQRCVPLDQQLPNSHATASLLVSWQ
jgi:hypothetical protein